MKNTNITIISLILEKQSVDVLFLLYRSIREFCMLNYLEELSYRQFDNWLDKDFALTGSIGKNCYMQALLIHRDIIVNVIDDKTRKTYNLMSLNYKGK